MTPYDLFPVEEAAGEMRRGRGIIHGAISLAIAGRREPCDSRRAWTQTALAGVVRGTEKGLVEVVRSAALMAPCPLAIPIIIGGEVVNFGEFTAGRWGRKMQVLDGRQPLLRTARRGY